MTKRCVKCYFLLVFKQSIGKYKCSKCRATYTAKEIDNLEFRKENHLQKQKEMEYPEELKEATKEIEGYIKEIKYEKNDYSCRLCIRPEDRILIKICAAREGKTMRQFTMDAICAYIESKGLDKYLTEESNTPEGE